jgi:hypothetical protein
VVVAAGKQSGKTVPPKELGITYPVIVDSSAIVKVPLTAPISSPGPRGGNEPPSAEVKRYDFVLQFVWQPTTPGSTLPPPQATAGAAGTPAQ